MCKLKDLKKDEAEWSNLVETAITNQTNEHGITIWWASTRTGRAIATTMSDYHISVAIPYIDKLISNINSRFSDTAGFYGNEVTIESRETHTHLHLLLMVTRCTPSGGYSKGLLPKKQKHYLKEKLTKPPTLQEIKKEMEATNAYTDIFPEIFKLLTDVV